MSRVDDNPYPSLRGTAAVDDWVKLRHQKSYKCEPMCILHYLLVILRSSLYCVLLLGRLKQRFQRHRLKVMHRTSGYQPTRWTIKVAGFAWVSHSATGRLICPPRAAVPRRCEHITIVQSINAKSETTKQSHKKIKRNAHSRNRTEDLLMSPCYE
jgi:hypothetical protein